MILGPMLTGQNLFTDIILIFCTLP